MILLSKSRVSFEQFKIRASLRIRCVRDNLHCLIIFYNFSTPKKEFFFAERTRGYIANIGPSCECASMIKMHLNSIRSDLLCTGPTSDACKESRPQPTSQIDDVTWNTSAHRVPATVKR